MVKRGIGLALGGGSVKGFAHIGVLKVLEENNIRVSHIAGTSIGSVIGALYASGYSANEIERTILKINWKELLDLTFPPKEGLIKGEKIEKVLRDILKNKSFSQLNIPFATTSIDLISGETLIFNKGDLTKAVRASISYPGILVPVHYGKMLLVDGGVLTPVPVDIVKQMGAKKVLAINLNQKKQKNILVSAKRKESRFREEFKDNIFDHELQEIRKYVKEKKIKLPFYIKVLLKTSGINHLLKNKKSVNLPEVVKILFRSVQVMADKLAEQSLVNADLVLNPKIKGINYLEFDKIKYIIKSGERITEKNIQKIKKLLK